MIGFPGLPSSPHVLLASVAGIAIAGVAAAALYNRSSPGAGWLASAMLLAAAVVLFAAFGRGLPRTRAVALAVGGLGLLATVPFVAFVVVYTGRGRHLGALTLLGYGSPLLVAAALYATTGYHGLYLQPPLSVRTVRGLVVVQYRALGPLVAPTLAYVGLLLVGALLLVAQTVVRHDRMYLGQSAALAVGTAAPLAAALPSVGGYRAVDAAAGLLVLSGLSFGYAAVRQRLFDFVPAVRQLGGQAAIADLDEGILIVDANDNVAKLNDAAASVLGCERSGAVGSPAAELFAAVGVEDPSATPATFERAGRTHEVTGSPITDDRDRVVGRTYVVRDVTRRELRKQRLQVLNRVLRHNVRNDMSVVKMHAGTVAEEGNRRLAQLGENMVSIADELVDMGEKVRRTEQLLSADELARQEVDVEAALESVVDEVAATAGAMTVDATVAVDEDVDVLRVNEALLELALENVVENAIEHNDTGVPRVAVTADRVDGGVRLTVADDGPGIPDSELAALESGRETDLQHASSLGLWLVLWSVDRLGGDLTIEHLAPTGTAVALWLPDHGGDDGAAADAADGTVRSGGDPPEWTVADEAVTAVAEGVADGSTAGAEAGADRTSATAEGTGATGEASAVDGGTPGGSTPVERPPRPPPASPISSGDDGDEAGEDAENGGASEDDAEDGDEDRRADESPRSGDETDG